MQKKTHMFTPIWESSHSKSCRNFFSRAQRPVKTGVCFSGYPPPLKNWCFFFGDPACFQGRLLLVFGRVRIVAILVLSEVRGIWGSCLELPGWYGLWSVVDHVVVGNASCWYRRYPKFGWDDVGCCIFSREESGKKTYHPSKVFTEQLMVFNVVWW